MSARRKRLRQRKLRPAATGPESVWAPPGELHEADEPGRLAYTRRQAAEALGVSIATIDRRVVPAVHTVKTPWGQRLIPVAELERFIREHLEPPRPCAGGGTAGRPPALPTRVVERIRLEYARGRGLAEIARVLNEQGVPTAHGRRQWWPSTVRDVLIARVGSVRSSSARRELSFALSSCAAPGREARGEPSSAGFGSSRGTRRFASLGRSAVPNVVGDRAGVGLPLAALPARRRPVGPHSRPRLTIGSLAQLNGARGPAAHLPFPQGGRGRPGVTTKGSCRRDPAPPWLRSSRI